MSKIKVNCSIGDKDFLTPSETCAYLDVDAKTLVKFRVLGLEPIRVTERKHYYSKKDINSFMESRRSQ